MEKDIKVDRKKKIINISLFIILILLLIFLGYTCFKKFLLEEIEPETTNISENDDEDTQDKQEEEIEQDTIIEDTQTIQRPNSVQKYTEESPVIEGQQAYIVTPTDIYKDEPATIVIYSHGSTGVITDDLSETYMSELREFAIQFPPHNYIFAASNQHGQNWGNTISIQDMINMKEWITDNYPVKTEIYLIGFSMGGLPTMNYATTYPDTISKIALLAPTIRSSEWDSERTKKLKGIDIKIWHGTADVNVPYSNSTYFLNKVSAYGVDIPLVRLEGKTHFDVDREYVQDIIEFFNS